MAVFNEWVHELPFQYDYDKFFLEISFTSHTHRILGEIIR